MTRVSVVAPSDLKQGYSLQVEIDGQTATVTCPYDVQAGETFEADALFPVSIEGPVKPDQLPTTLVPSTAPAAGSNLSANRTALTGEFQYGLCSCMDGQTCCRPVWWNTWILQCIPIAQLLNRFRWNACATPTQQSRQTTFAMVVGIYLTYYICHAVYSLTYKCTTMTNTNTGNSTVTTCATTGSWWILGFVVWSISIYIIVLLTRIRIGFRKHYQIEGNCCADFCTMVCCSCCSVMQMLRQTHDESKHPYKCCNCLTGLDDDAPEIV